MKPDIKNTVTNTSREYGLDLIKAICICLVLIWHLEPIDISIPKITAHSANIIFKEAQIALYFQLTLIAVPAFLISSQYLYIRKLEEHGYRYFLSRLGHLFSITIFWISFQCAFYYIFVAAKAQQSWTDFLPSSSTGWFSFLLNGGPSLPIVGGSVFYYLSILIVLTTLSTIFVWGSQFIWFELPVGMLVITGSLLYFQMQGISGGYIESSSIKNFVLYTPIAYFLYKYRQTIKFSLPGSLWCAYLFFCAWDTILRLAGAHLIVYGRVSIALGATALLCTFINIKTLRELKLIDFLSRYSLGIFALHKYFSYFITLQLTPLFSILQIRKKIPIGPMMINFRSPSIAILAITLTFLSVYILGRTPLKRFVK